jgi:hypothetical protein
MMCGSNGADKDAMTRQAGLADQSRSLDAVMRWAGNLVIVAVLPMRLGLLSTPLWFFVAYAVVAGCVLALTDSLGDTHEIVFWPDVRAYVLVRIMIVALVGLIPFTMGRTLW